MELTQEQSTELTAILQEYYDQRNGFEDTLEAWKDIHLFLNNTINANQNSLFRLESGIIWNPAGYCISRLTPNAKPKPEYNQIIESIKDIARGINA